MNPLAVIADSPQSQEETAAYWVREITAAWRGGLESVIRTGHLLIEAKSRLKHGQWLPMVAMDLPFSEDTAQRLMAIAGSCIANMVNTEHVRYLPNEWGTLYELSRLDEATFKAGIAQGFIYSHMERKAAAALLPRERHASSKPSPPPIPRNALAQCIDTVCAAIHETLCELEPKQYDRLFSGLRSALDIMESKWCGKSQS